MPGPELFSREGWLSCARHGVLGIAAPARYGGLDKDALTAALVTEALGYACADLGLVFAMAAHVYACIVPLVTFGTDAQRDRWLTKLISGRRDRRSRDDRAERGFRHLPHDDACRAPRRSLRADRDQELHEQRADRRRLPGPGRHRSEEGLLRAQHVRRREGHGRAPLGKPYDKLGLRSAPMADVYLDDCVVPAAHRIGSEGTGGSIFLHSMTWERTCLLAAYVGAMERVLERTIHYAKDRNQFGQPIGKFQGVSHKIADMKLRLESARLLMYRAAWSIAQRSDDELAVSLAKLAVSEAAVASALDAIQIHGAIGTTSGEIERFLRDSIPARVFSGTSEIQRNTIARVLGL